VSPQAKKLLNPFAWMAYGLNGLPDHDREAVFRSALDLLAPDVRERVRDAAAEVTETNCWFAVHDAGTLITAIEAQRAKS
jgi:hypothetical protein